MSAHRYRIPTVKIEVSKSSVRRLISPRIEPMPSVHRSISRAMPLLLGRKRLARPSCVSRSFGVTDINGPVHRQCDLLEHRAAEPPFYRFTPKHGMRNGLVRYPLPVRIAPQHPSSICAVI